MSKMLVTFMVISYNLAKIFTLLGKGMSDKLFINLFKAMREAEKANMRFVYNKAVTEPLSYMCGRTQKKPVKTLTCQLY